MTEQQPATLAAALAALQADLPHVRKNAQGQRSKYADLPNVSQAILPRLAELGLFFCCRPTMHADHGFVLAYELTHMGGETRCGFYPLPNNTPQTIGGSITYARRYALLAVTGVAADEDDDDAGEAEAEAREMRRRPPEVDEHGAATFAEQTRMMSGPEPGARRASGTAAERTEWTDPPPLPDPRTSGMRAMHGLWRELGVTAEPDIRAGVAEILGKPCESRADLTEAEITTVNIELRRRRDRQRGERSQSAKAPSQDGAAGRQEAKSRGG